MSGSQRRPLAGRLYEYLLWLLPAGVRRHDGAEMVDLFESLWRDASGWPDRISLMAKSFGSMLPIALLEWCGVVAARRPSASGPWEPVRAMRMAGRSLARAPLFSVLSVVLIGLGIGATTAVYTLVDHVLFRPLPYPQPERLVFVGDAGERANWAVHPGPVIRAMQGIEGVESWAVADAEPANLTGEGTPLRVRAGIVSVDFFRVYGARPAIGRLFEAEDASADRAVLSYATWSQHFNGDPGIIGQTIGLENEPLVVIGVLAADFQPPQVQVGRRVDVWRPIDWERAMHGRIDAESLTVVGRLASNTSMEVAQAELAAVAAEMARRHPDRFLIDDQVAPLPIVPLHARTVYSVRPQLHLLFAAVALLLLVSALNVAHLFLARGVTRRKEMAVRRALGARHGALVRQLLVESLVLAAGGCVLGVGIAHGALAALLRFDPTGLPISGPIAIDLPILAFAAGASCVTAMLFGLVPALRTSGEQRAAAGHRGSTDTRGTRRMRDGLVVAEVAIALLIVTQAGLMLRSFAVASSTETGLDARNVVALQLREPAAASSEDFVRMMNELRRSIEAQPGVATAAYGMHLPFELTGGRRGGWSNRFEMVAAGKVRDSILLRQMPVSPTYFETLGIPLLGGQPWSEAEADSRPPSEGDRRPILPVVLSESAAEHFFGDAQLAVGSLLHHAQAPDRVWEVRAVVGDIRHWGLDQPMPATLYLPTYTMPRRRRAISMAVRYEGAPPADHAQTLRAAVWRVGPTVPVAQVEPLNRWIWGSTAPRRFDALLYGVFAGAGLLLAAAGVYGSLLFAVNRRRREMGIRLALGATSQRVRGHVVGTALRLAGVGALIGLVFSLWSGKLLESRLYQVSAWDPLAFACALAVITLAVVFASWLPAQRASRSNPAAVLRAD